VSRLVFIAALIMTVVVFATGAMLQLMIAFIALRFDLQGPNSASSIYWFWLGLSALTMFFVSLLFCRWLVRRAQNAVHISKVFE
jgi:H+/Cl- antiporter ClcA